MAEAMALKTRPETAAQRATTEPALVRWALTGIALAFLGLFLFVPLLAVFEQALEKGFAVYLASFREPDARAVGEYGSVVFISGNLPMKTEIAPLLIITKLEQYDYTGATAIAVVLLVVSFALLLTINLLQWWTRRRSAL